MRRREGRPGRGTQGVVRGEVGGLGGEGDKVWSPGLTSVVTKRLRLVLTPFTKKMWVKKQKRRTLGNNMEKIIIWPGGSGEAGRRQRTH